MAPTIVLSKRLRSFVQLSGVPVLVFIVIALLPAPSVDARGGSGPVAAYSFDEGEGEVAYDSAGNHDGTRHGAAWTEAGHSGGALSFDAASHDRLTIPDSPEFDLAEGFTLEAWVDPEEARSWAPVFARTGAEEPDFSYLLYARDGSSHPNGQVGDAESESAGVHGSEAMPLNSWSHLALTYDGEDIRLYVNGKLAEVETAVLPKNASSDLRIGGNELWHEYFDGKIDDVRIYDRALDVAELNETMNASLPIAITEIATEVEANDAILTGTADANGSKTNYFFEYGPTKSYGDVVMGEELDSEPKKIEIDEAVIDLAPETTYHYRLVANSSVGTTYGKDQTLFTAARAMTVGEEEELSGAENSMALTASESKAGPGSFYGMMWTGNLGKMLEENAFDAVENSGARMLRLRVQPGDQSVINEAFKVAAEHDITILPYLGDGAFPKAGTEYREDWINYAKEMVQRYGPDSSFSHPVKAWEVWNEPNMPFAGSAEREGNVNPEEFAGFMKEMSEALRSSSEGGIQVLAPGLFGYRVPGCHPACHLTPRAFFKRMDLKLSELGYSNAYDAISLHPYVFKIGMRGHQHAPRDEGDVKQASRAIKRVITSLHHLKLGKPLWITELGFPVANPGNVAGVPAVSNPIQKQLVQASFSMMQNNRQRLNIAHAFYYNIQDTDNPGWDSHSGLLTVKGQARPAWNAYSSLADGKSCPHAPC